MTEKEYLSEEEKKNRDLMVELFQTCPIPKEQMLSNLGLFLSSKNLSRILFMNQIYQQIINVPGIVVEFGTRWGQNAALFSSLRGIYEPFHRHRKVVCFDTFSGFPSISKEDGKSDLMNVGNIATTENYEQYLSQILNQHEKSNPLSHIRKFEIIKGDATKLLPVYLQQHPETIVALAYFDMDLYKPTKKCLKEIQNRMVKGGVVAFDELNDQDSPGETIALNEVFGLNKIKLRRYPYTARTSYFVVE